MVQEYHVAKNGSDWNQGSKELPFLTINRAATVAQSGDTVIVHEGEYREWVKPQRTGLSDSRRITYKSAESETVKIKGSEQIRDWELVEGSVWKVSLSNDYFQGFNPYQEEIAGDWIVDKPGVRKHLGDVYLNGMSFYEAEDYGQLLNPVERKEVLDHWTNQVVPVHHVEQTNYLWYAEVDEAYTTIFANFQDYNPNESLVEINVRKCCFYPDKTGIDYITVKGFEMAQAATPWTPPSADQPGLLGANWSKGWIIEDNVIHDSKCSGISIGKEASTGHNYYTERKDKPGYQYQLESVFTARHAGWSKETIGSHIIRNNTIYDCGQNGIVGHLGCVFSKIYDNHIYNIALKREFYGYEIAGIKLHAAIDVQIFNNRIHDCSLGTWLDWQNQGTRVSGNLYYFNNRDLFIEVSHGPYLVDHNILASDYALDNFAQGGAYVNNLICGKMVHVKVLDRATPYHFPHSTEVAGFAVVYGGDDRYYNNIFIGTDKDVNVGTAYYNGYPASLDEYMEKVQARAPGDIEIFMQEEQPVYVNHNAYFNGASPVEHEQDNLVMKEFDPKLRIIEEKNEVYLSCQFPDDLEQLLGKIHTTNTLNRTRIVDAEFENPDGSMIILDSDYLGEEKKDRARLGPINRAKKGSNHFKVWG